MGAGARLAHSRHEEVCWGSIVDGASDAEERAPHLGALHSYSDSLQTPSAHRASPKLRDFLDPAQLYAANDIAGCSLFSAARTSTVTVSAHALRG